MNFRSGVMRLWAVGSLTWIAYVLYGMDFVQCEVTPFLGFAERTKLWWCDSPLASPELYYRGLAFRAVGWPLLAAIVLMTAGWIVDGFRQQTPSND